MIRLLALTTALTLLGTAPAFADGHPGKTDVFAGESGLARATADGARWDAPAGGFRLEDDPAGGYRRAGSVTIGELRYNAGFDAAVASWNADCPPGTFVRVELAASADDGRSWSCWYEMASWGDASADRRAPDARTKRDALGRVNEDTLELSRTATRLRYRVWLQTERPAVTPLVTLAAVTVIDRAKTVAPDESRSAAWGKTVGAEFRSQSKLTSDISYRGCGPTSLAMALSAHRVAVPTQSVATACWDGQNGLYGNWPFLAAAGSRLMRECGEPPGRRWQSYVSWAPDWKDVEAEIAAGNPCLVSLYFGKGELKGSMTEASDGHLILVRGFTPEGDVVCLDPAARTPERGHVVYDRRELHRARHGGPIIVLRPEK